MPPEMPPPPPAPAPQPGSMWDTITSVFTSGNAIFILGTIVILALLFGIFAKLGIISVHKKGVKIGRSAALTERMVLRKQIEYVQKYCLAIEPQLHKIFEKKEFHHKGAEDFYFKHIAGLISNEIEQWVLVNNISQGSNFVQSKQLELRVYILSKIGKCEYSDAALTKAVNKWVSEIVSHINLIRKSGAVIG